MTARATELAVVIPVRGRHDVLARTVAALRDGSPAGLETIIVVDGLDQPVPDLPGATILHRDHGGPAAARNHGVAATRRPLLLFLGADMVPRRGLVDAHLRWHSQRPEPTLAVLGHVDWHSDLADNRILAWLDWSSTQFDYTNMSGQIGSDVGFGHFYSCNVSLKRSMFEQAGGFDPDFLFYYEDLDMGYRLGEAGMKLVYEPEALVEHLHDYDLESVRRRFEGIALGERLMADKHEWFTPFFHRRVTGALARQPVNAIWSRVVDRLPRSSTRLRSAVERRANAWYYQQLGPSFLQAWDRAAHVVELRRYLGDDFDASMLGRYDRAVDDEFSQAGDEVEFYRTSEAYLYDLTVFAMSGTKAPYREAIMEVVQPPARLLDYGCGIGADGLELIAHGYDVQFADFDNPSTRYLRWRLAERGLDAPVHDIERDDIQLGFDAVYAFDVVEHVADPIAFLHQVEQLGSLVVVNLLEEDEEDHAHALHHHLPIEQIIARATARGLLLHELHHGRSHLLVYRGRQSAAAPK